MTVPVPTISEIKEIGTGTVTMYLGRYGTYVD